MAAQAMMEKVRSETAKAVGQQHLDRTRQEQENAFKHTQLQAKTQVDLQKLDIEGQRMLASIITSRSPSWRAS